MIARKRRHTLWGGLAALAAALLLLAPALAGNWAVISVETLVTEIQAGKPLTIQFTVLQHGNKPMSDLTPAIQAINAASGAHLTFDALPLGQPGRYAAEITLPEPGRWDWSIQAFTMNQVMPPITVTAASTANAVSSPTPAGSLAAGLAALALGGAAVWLRRTSAARLAPGLLAIALLAGLFAGLLGLQASGRSTARAAQREQGSAADTPTSASYGDALFTAKGCVTCHTNARASIPAEFSIDIGPNLTKYKANPEYLHLWLQDPQAVRPDTYMPNLHLSSAEIDALIAFLNAGQAD
jgi:cytochrome c2